MANFCHPPPPARLEVSNLPGSKVGHAQQIHDEIFSQSDSHNQWVVHSTQKDHIEQGDQDCNKTNNNFTTKNKRNITDKLLQSRQSDVSLFLANEELSDFGTISKFKQTDANLRFVVSHADCTKSCTNTWLYSGWFYLQKQGQHLTFCPAPRLDELRIVIGVRSIKRVAVKELHQSVCDDREGGHEGPPPGRIVYEVDGTVKKERAFRRKTRFVRSSKKNSLPHSAEGSKGPLVRTTSIRR